MAHRIISFDTETTGKNPDTDKVVSFSAIEMDENFEVIDELSLLINPGIPIPAEATAVHGITDEMVDGVPLFKDVSHIIYEFLSRGALSGFNIEGFDIPILIAEFERCNLGQPFPLQNHGIIDTSVIFRKFNLRTLSGVYKHYLGNELENAHDAMADTVASAVILKAQVQLHGIGNTMEDWSSHGTTIGIEFMDYAKKISIIDGVPCYAFGKDAGKSVVDNPGFGKWMLGQAFITKNTKDVVRKLIG